MITSLKAYYVADTLLSTLHVITYFILTKVYQIGDGIFSIFKRRELRHREIKYLIQGSNVRK